MRKLTRYEEATDRQLEALNYALSLAKDMTIAIAVETLKHLVLVNAGALAGVLTYLATKHDGPSQNMPLAAIAFGVGVVLALIAMALTYHGSSHALQATVNDLFVDETSSEGEMQKTWLDRFPDMGVGSAWLSLGAFVVGLCFGARALLAGI